MPTIRCLKGDKALLRNLRIKEGRKEKLVVHDALFFYSKSKEHKKLTRKQRDFVKKREKEDEARAKTQLKERTEKAEEAEAFRLASGLARRGLQPEEIKPEETEPEETEPAKAEDQQ